MIDYTYMHTCTEGRWDQKKKTKTHHHHQKKQCWRVYLGLKRNVYERIVYGGSQSQSQQQPTFSVTHTHTHTHAHVIHQIKQQQSSQHNVWTTVRTKTVHFIGENRMERGNNTHFFSTRLLLLLLLSLSIDFVHDRYSTVQYSTVPIVYEINRQQQQYSNEKASLYPPTTRHTTRQLRWSIQYDSQSKACPVLSCQVETYVENREREREKKRERGREDVFE